MNDKWGVMAMKDKLFLYCEEALDLKNAKLSDEYYYSSLPLCILDAVYSIGVRYTATRNVVLRYCQKYNLPTSRNMSPEYPPGESQHTISQLVENIELVGAESFACHVLNNLQRTSTVSGILKSEAVYLWAKIFKEHDIEVFHDISTIGKEVENKILKIKGQRSGISLSYFYMLSGNDNLCKPDRHILRFLSKGLHREIKDYSEAQAIMCDVTATLKEKYAHLSVRTLDHAIWVHMSNSDKEGKCLRRKKK